MRVSKGCARPGSDCRPGMAWTDWSATSKPWIASAGTAASAGRKERTSRANPGVNRSSKVRSALVLVVAAPPDARLVTPLRGAVEPLVHAPEAVQSARIGRIRVVSNAVLERERAHARPFAGVRGRVGSAHGREGDRPLAAAFPRRL